MATKKSASKKSTKKGGTAKKGGATKKAAAKKAGAKAAPVNPGKCSWQAVQDNMPPLPSRLRVTGKCRFPTPGYKVTLKEAVPQGINPRILLLRKTVTPPKGIVIQIPQTVDVTFTKKTKTQYTHVTILPEVVTIKVKQVF